VYVQRVGSCSFEFFCGTDEVMCKVVFLDEEEGTTQSEGNFFLYERCELVGRSLVVWESV